MLQEWNLRILQYRQNRENPGNTFLLLFLIPSRRRRRRRHRLRYLDFRLFLHYPLPLLFRPVLLFHYCPDCLNRLSFLDFLLCLLCLRGLLYR